MLMITIGSSAQCRYFIESENLHTSVLMLMADHQTFSIQFWQFNLTHLLYIYTSSMEKSLIGKYFPTNLNPYHKQWCDTPRHTHTEETFK